MANKTTDSLFQLIHALEKSEKRNFKLYIKRSSGNKDLKIIELFDALDKLSEYNEAVLLKRLTSIQKPQLANTKAHLYKQLLSSRKSKLSFSSFSELCSPSIAMSVFKKFPGHLARPCSLGW